MINENIKTTGSKPPSLRSRGLEPQKGVFKINLSITFIIGGSRGSLENI